MTLDSIGLLGGKDRLHEISMRLEESHLAYLQLDDSPQKLQARHKLEGFIKEYLCHVPNERKYVFQETADILHRSAATVKNFSGYRACTAWSAISLYAANLLAQPWRKEYRTLRTYSGYYKHEIEANLIGAELMFELMGYKHTGLGVLTLEGPIDPDKVSSVSRDAIVAFVECQILKEIWENVSKTFTISWLEVLEFRWNSVGTSEQAIRALNFRFLERMHQIREKSCASAYRDYRHVQPLGMDVPLSSMTQPTIPYHLMTNNYNSAILPGVCKPESVYPTSDGNFYFTPMDSSATLANRFAAPYACPAPPPRFYPANFGNSTILSAMPLDDGTSVPCGRLIEFDTPVPVANYERNLASFNELPTKSSKSRVHEAVDRDECDFRRSLSSENERPFYARIEKKSASAAASGGAAGKSSRSANDEARNNDWEFVYKSLESLGYSKDLGERDDVLRKKELMQEARNSRTLQKTAKSLGKIEADEKYGSKRRSGGLRETNFNDGNLGSLANGQENRSREFSSLRGKSSLELQDPCLTFTEAGNDKNCLPNERLGNKYSNTLPNSRAAGKSGGESSAKNSEAARESRLSETRNASEIRWNCAFCTFLNPPGRVICEMCGKSKRKGNEDKPLASGGKECPKCTLVNEKDAATCEACSASLKDSPTYI